MSGLSRQVFTTTAARHADVNAFLTPADESGSMNEAASPTRSARPSAARVASYSEASHAHACVVCLARPKSLMDRDGLPELPLVDLVEAGLADGRPLAVDHHRALTPRRRQREPTTPSHRRSCPRSYARARRRTSRHIPFGGDGQRPVAHLQSPQPLRATTPDAA